MEFFGKIFEMPEVDTASEHIQVTTFGGIFLPIINYKNITFDLGKVGPINHKSLGRELELWVLFQQEWTRVWPGTDIFYA